MLAISTNPRGVDGHAVQRGKRVCPKATHGLCYSDSPDGYGKKRKGGAWQAEKPNSGHEQGKPGYPAGIKPGRGFVEETNMDEWTEAEIAWERSTRRFEAEYQEGRESE